VAIRKKSDRRVSIGKDSVQNEFNVDESDIYRESDFLALIEEREV
jgi:hypothetical protein